MVGDEGTMPHGASTDGYASFRLERPPQRRRGYDIEATDALIGQLTEQYEAVEAECASLRQEVARLEGDLVRSRDREQSVSSALIAAKQHADAILEDARREAKEILGRAQADSEARTERADHFEREREEAERELERLRRIQRDVHDGLTSFLLQAVELLRSEQEEDQVRLLESTADKPDWADPLETDVESDGTR